VNKQLIQAILNTLSLIGDRALPLAVIASQVRGSVVLAVTDEAVLGSLRWCQEQGWIERRVDTIDQSEMWYLVDAGRIAMRSHR
jgi:hypothetical protein